MRRNATGLENYYGDLYCDDNDEDAYIHRPFRRFEYYATFTENQYISLVILLRYLTARYNINRDLLPVDLHYTTNNDIIKFNGIVSHVNYRRYGKEDIGPAFDWERVIQEVIA